MNHKRVGNKLVPWAEFGFYRLCPECAKVFDLRIHEQALDWATGHDCEDDR